MMNRGVMSPLLLPLIGVFYSIGLWRYSIPLTGDQKTYLSIAMEMRKAHEWIIPTLFHEPNFLKPPFEYWMTILGWNLFGFNNFGAFFPSVLALLGTALVAQKIFEHFFNEKGNAVALFFSATLGTMTYGTTAQMEIWIVLFYLFAWYLALKQRTYLGMTVVGIMAWIKGPLYPVLWVVSELMYRFLHRNTRSLFSAQYLFSRLWGMGVGLLWFYLAARTHEKQILAVFFQQENFEKAGGNHSSPWSLWGEFLYTLFPWLILAVVSFAAHFRKVPWIKKLEEPFGKFVLSYSALPALFFTFFPYRVNTYLYLLTPMVALVVVRTLGRNFEFKISRWGKVLVAVLGVAFLAGLSFLYIQNWISSTLYFSCFFAFLLWGFAHFLGTGLGVGIISLILVNLIRLSAIEIGEGELKDLRTFVEHNHPSRIAYFVQKKDVWHEYGLISSALGIEIETVFSFTEMNQILENNGLVILNDEQNQVASSATCTDWPRLKRKIKVKELQGRFDEASLRHFRLCQKTM